MCLRGAETVCVIVVAVKARLHIGKFYVVVNGKPEGTKISVDGFEFFAFVFDVFLNVFDYLVLVIGYIDTCVVAT